jgi:hypothetical protein
MKTSAQSSPEVRERAVHSQGVKMTITNKALACPQDRVNRQSRAVPSNPLWVTYVSTSTGCLYVALLVEVFALRILGWKVSAYSKAQVIRRHTWKTLPEVELATLDLVDRFNHRRLPGPIGNITAAVAGQRRPKRPAIGNRSRYRWRRDSHHMAPQFSGWLRPSHVPICHCIALDARCEALTSARSNVAASSSAPRLRLT